VRYFAGTWRRIVAATLLTLTLAATSSALAAERTIRITRTDCDRLVDYVEPPGVAYQPGVDVNGRPVAPADLDGGWQMQLPDYISIDITRDLPDRFGLPRDSRLFAAEAFIGVVDIDLRDGRVRFNGSELSDPETRALAALCREGAIRQH